MAEDIKKILIRGVNWIGDAVLTIPAIKAIRHAFPDAHISLLVKPWVAEIFKENPDIDEIILYKDKFNSIAGKLKLARILRAKGFDTAILLQNAFDAALITWLTGIPERIGYKRDFRSFLLTKAIPVGKTEQRAKSKEQRLRTTDNGEGNTSFNLLKEHQVYYYLNLLNAVGIESIPVEPYIYLTDNERQWAKNLLNSSLIPRPSSLIIGINPGAAYGSAKRWMPERFAELIHRIIDELNGRVVIFGSQSEVETTNAILKKLATRNSQLATRILVMAGKTSLRKLAALISECDAFITNDSGPMHIASALSVPIVAIFGSTDKTATGPIGEGYKVIAKELPCAPCLKRECPEGHLKCMTEITAGEVFNALQEVLPQEKAVFLDKDGTLTEDKGYLNSFDDLVIFPNTKENLQRLKNAGFKLIGITNQSGIARGIVDEEFVKKSNAYLQKTLRIDDFYYCPHHPDEHCSCRKPEPMLLLRARLKHRINLKASYVIGDKESDMQLAKKIGATGIFLSSAPPPVETSASYMAKDLNDAVKWILEKEKQF